MILEQVKQAELIAKYDAEIQTMEKFTQFLLQANEPDDWDYTFSVIWGVNGLLSRKVKRRENVLKELGVTLNGDEEEEECDD